MNIMENPLKYLIILLIILAILLLFFKVVDYINSKNPSTSKKEKEPEKVEKKEEIVPDKEESSVVDSSNYLFDRFVLSPSKEDNLIDDNNQIFLSDKDYEDIKNRQIDIMVQEDDYLSGNNDKQSLYNKIEKMANENIEHKEKLLKEYEGLSREMKLLLIENIMSKYR